MEDSSRSKRTVWCCAPRPAPVTQAGSHDTSSGGLLDHGMEPLVTPLMQKLGCAEATRVPTRRADGPECTQHQSPRSKKQRGDKLASYTPSQWARQILRQHPHRTASQKTDSHLTPLDSPPPSTPRRILDFDPQPQNPDRSYLASHTAASADSAATATIKHGRTVVPDAPPRVSSVVFNHQVPGRRPRPRVDQLNGPLPRPRPSGVVEQDMSCHRPGGRAHTAAVATERSQAEMGPEKVGYDGLDAGDSLEYYDLAAHAASQASDHALPEGAPATSATVTAPDCKSERMQPHWTGKQVPGRRPRPRVDQLNGPLPLARPSGVVEQDRAIHGVFESQQNCGPGGRAHTAAVATERSQADMGPDKVGSNRLDAGRIKLGRTDSLEHYDLAAHAASQASDHTLPATSAHGCKSERMQDTHAYESVHVDSSKKLLGGGNCHMSPMLAVLHSAKGLRRFRWHSDDKLVCNTLSPAAM
jgi:hypothetical protein